MHAVLPWKPQVMIKGMNMTPGRFAVVFYTPEYCFKASAKKAHGHGLKTGHAETQLSANKKRKSMDEEPKSIQLCDMERKRKRARRPGKKRGSELNLDKKEKGV